MYKVIKHFFNPESGSIELPGSVFESQNKEVVELLLKTGYLLEDKPAKKTTRKKAGGSDVV